MNSPVSAPGPFAVCTHTFEARDPAHDRLFSYDIWRPDEPGAWPLVLYSHHSHGKLLDFQDEALVWVRTRSKLWMMKRQM